MNYIIGNVYPFKDKTYGGLYPWVVKKVVGFDFRWYAKTEIIGASFMEKDDAVEYCIGGILNMQDKELIK